MESFLSEILKMHQLSHPHLMNLIGVCLSDDSFPLIIMPYMENGSLFNYLKKKRTDLFLGYDVNEEDVS